MERRAGEHAHRKRAGFECEHRICFNFEAPGFQLGFKCSLRQGHEGDHQYRSYQRQVTRRGSDVDGVLLNYRLTWEEKRL